MSRDTETCALSRSTETIWIRHLVTADARFKGRPMSPHNMAEMGAFEVAVVDPLDAPLVVTVTRAVRNPTPARDLLEIGFQPGDAERQVVEMRVHEERWLRPLFDLDEVTPLRVDAVERAYRIGTRIGWPDDPGRWADTPGGRGSVTREQSGYVEVDETAVHHARNRMAERIATLRVIDGVLWCPTQPPMWTREFDSAEMSLVIPSLDHCRIDDVARVARLPRSVRSRNASPACVTLDVGRDDAMAVLGCDTEVRPETVVDVHAPDLLNEGDGSAYRCMLLAHEIDERIGIVPWEMIEPRLRMALAMVSAECAMAAEGGTHPEIVLDRAASMLGDAVERQGNAAGVWPLMDSLLEDLGTWVGIRHREVECLRALAEDEGLFGFSP